MYSIGENVSTIMVRLLKNEILIPITFITKQSE